MFPPHPAWRHPPCCPPCRTPASVPNPHLHLVFNSYLSNTAVQSTYSQPPCCPPCRTPASDPRPRLHLIFKSYLSSTADQSNYSQHSAIHTHTQSDSFHSYSIRTPCIWFRSHPACCRSGKCCFCWFRSFWDSDWSNRSYRCGSIWAFFFIR